LTSARAASTATAARKNPFGWLEDDDDENDEDMSSKTDTARNDFNALEEFDVEDYYTNTIEANNRNVNKNNGDGVVTTNGDGEKTYNDIDNAFLQQNKNTKTGKTDKETNTGSGEDNTNNKSSKEETEHVPRKSKTQQDPLFMAATATTSSQPLVESPSLLDPANLGGGQDSVVGRIPYPESLSPSAIMEFQACPQNFLFRYLYKLESPTNHAMAKGSMCHAALEKIFDLDPTDRTLLNLQNLFRSVWSDHRQQDEYKVLFETTAAAPESPNDDDDDVDNINVPAAATATNVVRDLDAERVWGREGLSLLENYVRMEDPSKVARPNPVKREVWVRANLALDHTQGVTGTGTTRTVPSDETFLVRGIVDRLDLVKVTDSNEYRDSASSPSSSVALRLIDYKTGKAPNFKYTDSTNGRIRQEKLFQLKIYALLLREQNAARQRERKKKQQQQNQSSSAGIMDDNDDDSSLLEVRWLRLFYLTSHTPNGSADPGPAAYVDLDLGATREARYKELSDDHRELSGVWQAIIALVDQQDPKAFVGCNRSFCNCHETRKRFVPGTLWTPPP